MAGPVLLVHDDIASIAAVRRLLVRDGYEVLVVSSAADALIAFGHYLPSLIVLAPQVEGGRGSVVLEELRQHPDAKLARVLLLGETIPGFGFPVAPLPLDGTLFVQQVAELIRGGATEADQWTVVNITPPLKEPAARHPARDEWRATPPPEVGGSGLAADLFADVNSSDWSVAAMTPEERESHERTVLVERQADAAANMAFEQTHRQMEAEAIASLDKTLPRARPPSEDAEGVTLPGDRSVDDLIADALNAPDPVVAEIQASLAARRRQREQGRKTKKKTDDIAGGETAPAEDDAEAERARLRKARREVEEGGAKERERLDKLRAKAQAQRALDAKLFEATPGAGTKKLDVDAELSQLEAEQAAKPRGPEAELGDDSERTVLHQRASVGDAPEATTGRAQVDAGGDAADEAARAQQAWLAEEEANRRAAEALARQAAAEAAQREIELAARRAEEAAREELEAAAQREIEEAARRAAEDARADAEAIATAQREREDAVRREEEAMLAAAAEAARVEAEQTAKREAEEAAARARAVEEEAARREAEEAAAREIAAAEEAARREAEEAAAREIAAAEEAARREAEEAAAREIAAAEEAARREAEEAAAREIAAAEEAARREAEEAAAREIAAAKRAAEEAARREAEEAAAREIAAARRAAEEAAEREIALASRRASEAARRAEEAGRREAELAVEREIARLEAEQAKRKAAEEAAARELESAAKRDAEEVARREIERLSKQAEERSRKAEEERLRREELERLASEAEARADAEARARAEAETRAHTQLQKLASEREEARLRSVRLAEEAAEREVAANEAQARALELEEQARAAHEEIVRAEALARTERERREQLTIELEHLRKLAEDAQQRAKHAEGEAAEQRQAHQAAMRAAEAQRAAAEAAARAEAEERARHELEQRLAEAQAELQKQKELLEADKRAAIERLRQEMEGQRKDVEEQLKAAAEEAERARAEAKSAAERTLIPLERAGRPPLPVMGAGAVSATQLAALVSKLATSKSEARLELQADEAQRTLWFRRGVLIGAHSNVPHDSLLDRARRDGLIDARQENELRLLRNAGSAELLRVLKLRGHVRETEAVPLVQRHHEQICLEAFSEPSSTYRLSLEPILDEVVAAELPRPPMHIVAEALRRVLSSEELLRECGGMQAIASLTDAEIDGKALGFTDRERRLLSLIDGTATIEEVLLGAGIRQEQGLKALAVARALRMIEVAPPAKGPTVALADLDIERLEAKYEELAEADYFSLLGLPRSAGADEVSRAFQTLTREFDPLKFVGHPDVGLQHRARVVTDALSEAARALQDDRLRAEYARNLLD